MKLTNIEISNFRGIKHASVFFPQDSRILCIIGSGDSGKTTILNAIEWVLWPTWNLIATDTDFYNCETNSPIVITASYTEIPKELLKIDKFGLYLRDYYKSQQEGDDEPTDDGMSILTIRLTICKDLVPKWEVITNRTEPKPIGHNDRRILSFGIVGFDYSRDFQWGRNSVLQKYTDSKESLHDAFTHAMRAAVENTELSSLDQMAPIIHEIGKQYGVSFKGEIHNRIIMQNGSYSTAVGIFDDKVPFAQRGLGSRRLLSIGMNINAYNNGTLILVDEIETGLEPYRISTLINELRSQFKDSGQLIMTTHSINVLCECRVNEVVICSNIEGETKLHYLGDNEEVYDEMQALLRGCPDSFLCKRVIVCEGKTEVGILRALDNYNVSSGKARLAYYGVGMIPGGGGNTFFLLAKLLHECCYDVAILMDSDVSDEETQKQKMKELGIKVFDWETGFAIEETLFKETSLDCVNAMLEIAVEDKSIEHVKLKLDEGFNGKRIPYSIENDTIRVLDDITEEERVTIGRVAKKKKAEWFKNTSKGELIGNCVFSEFTKLHNSVFKTQITNLMNWVTGNET